MTTSPIALTGTGTQSSLARGAAELAFGARDVDEGPTDAQGSTVTNTGSEDVVLDAVGLEGPDAGQFERVLGGSDCVAGATLPAGASCNVRARFDPAATGPANASLTVTSALGVLTVGLTGTGTQTLLALTPGTTAFGARNLGEGPSPAQASIVRNVGTEPVALGAATVGGPGATQFAIQGGQPADCAPGRTLGSGEQCEVRTAFDPTSLGVEDRDADGRVRRAAGHERADRHRDRGPPRARQRARRAPARQPAGASPCGCRPSAAPSRASRSR